MALRQTRLIGLKKVNGIVPMVFEERCIHPAMIGSRQTGTVLKMPTAPAEACEAGVLGHHYRPESFTKSPVICPVEVVLESR